MTLPGNETFAQVLQSINNSELRIAIEKLFAFIGVDAAVTYGTADLVVDGITGDVTGDVTGDLHGDNLPVATAYTSDTDLEDSDVPTGLIELSNCTLSNFSPSKGRWYIFTCKDKSVKNCVLRCSDGVYFYGIVGTATFNNVDETLVVFSVSETRLLIVENVSVGLN